MDKLTEILLNKPVGPALEARPGKGELTRQVEVKGDVAQVTINDTDVAVPAQAQTALEANGLDPAEWEVTGARTSEWTMANGETGTSTRYSFARRQATSSGVPLDIDGLLDDVRNHETRTRDIPQGDHGYLVAIGDMQFGKIDGDGAEGTLRRTIDSIDQAADVLWRYAQHWPIGEIEISWLGDHVEGFQSQGGANVWRTPLTLSEQIRLTRRVMLHALLTFADLAEKVSMVAVPGNHGETARFSGKGVTRYDDSHDTESLIALSDAAALNPAAFEHVKFYVPGTDDMTVTTEVAGTRILHAHGHQFRPGKHFDWWRGQAFHNPSAYSADLMLAGHMHHFFAEADGKRLFLQVPSLESESTWYRHSTGSTGDPGIVVAITKDGVTNPLEVIRP